jgi:hypothetical protein
MSDGELLRTLHLVDPDSGTLSQGPSTREPRYGHKMFSTASGRVVVLGGSGKQTVRGSTPPHWRSYDGRIPVEYLEPGATSWSSVELDIPCTNWSAAARIDEDRVLVAGGLVDERPTRRAWLFSLSSLSILHESEMPTARAYDEAVYVPGIEKVFVAGGDIAFGKVETWDVGSRLWLPTTEWADYAVGVRFFVAKPGALLAVGGGLCECDIRDVALRWSNGTWTREEPAGRDVGRNATLTKVAPGVHLAIGSEGEDGASVAKVYETDEGRWRNVTGPREARGNHAAVAVGDGRVVVFGGLDCVAVEVGTPDWQ